jgi:hypothetical protein
MFAQVFAKVSCGNNATPNLDGSGNNSTVTANRSNVTPTMSIQQLDNIMKQLASSDKPDDITTLAYIWGFPPLI